MWKWTLVASVLSGCVVQAADLNQPLDGPIAGDAPRILEAGAEVYQGYGEIYWSFDARVEAGSREVDRVLMEVYDEGCGNCLVERIELLPTWGEYWEHDWHGSLDVLDPYYDRYSIDVLVFDDQGRMDSVEIWPETL